jgi:hypothetical protein
MSVQRKLRHHLEWLLLVAPTLVEQAMETLQQLLVRKFSMALAQLDMAHMHHTSG